ncbi:acyltransferase [Motilimonas cestriensis]|uniref:Acyltransferase n=1 Tax=Motilimonas cestriensis TaxID=2742685 RepID=A0ABS8W5X4_9GAMM|nr:acyltransferase [Motilimonas cestriensis]MCE2594384.1 acyltransferase [Motilimonas cestriensis]
MYQVSKVESLNGIRGFAVLLVLLSHASNVGLSLHPALSFSGAGRYGVFLFFVLSAFLLTRQFIEYQPTREQLWPWVKRYLLRRLIRIYPLFVAALLTYWLITHLHLGLRLEVISLDDVVAAIFLLDGKDIFWTIPVEFQYYFLLPIAYLLLNKITSIWRTSVILMVFSVAWWLLFPPEYVANLLPFLPIFVLGSGCAFLSHQLTEYLNHHPGRFLRLALNALALASLSAFFLLTPGFYNQLFSAEVVRTEFHEQFMLLALVSCVLVVSVVHGNGIVKKVMESRLLIFWGNVSFSAYLGHMIVLAFCRKLTLAVEFKLLIFLFLTSGLSYLSFKFFELPLSKPKNFKKIAFVFSSLRLNNKKSS